MLAPRTQPTIPAEDLNRGVREQMMLEDQSLTEEYGEESGGARNLTGGVDFFSSLGTERQKKQKPNRPNPDDVRELSLFAFYPSNTFAGPCHSRERA